MSSFDFDPAFGFGPLMGMRNLCASDMPVIPISGGGIDNGNGTADRCFGYKRWNLEERRDFAHGPANSIGPPLFDGVQPTFFLQVPPSRHRHYRVFAADVPLDSEPVVWTLNFNGCGYATPGHTGSTNYKLDNTWYPAHRGTGRECGSIAPLAEFVEPAESEDVGRAASGARAGPVTARVGGPITLNIAVAQPRIGAHVSEPKSFDVYWYKYQGSFHEVVSSETTIRLDGGDTVERRLDNDNRGGRVPAPCAGAQQQLSSPVLLDQPAPAGDGRGVRRRRPPAAAAVVRWLVRDPCCVGNDPPCGIQGPRAPPYERRR